MSKRELKKYIKRLSKKQLEDQVLDLYGKFKPVKEYYNFVFNPKEEKLITECKFKINKEYFPTTGRRKPKKRRSTAQKCIKNFILLGMEPVLIADIMLFNIETAQKFSANNNMPDSFYTSMLKSYLEAVNYIGENSLDMEFNNRIKSVISDVWKQKWINKIAFGEID